MTFHDSAYDKGHEKHDIKKYTVPELVACLKTLAKGPIRRKEESRFFNAGVFEPPEGAGGYRRQMYFKQSSFMVLDFDNGNLSPDDFVRIFWREAKRGHKRSFVICNSFSRSPEKPNSFRVIMFYKRPATTIDQHKAILASVVRRLEQNGFSANSAKLDPNCKSGIQSFYLPCTNKAHETWAFFEKLWNENA